MGHCMRSCLLAVLATGFLQASPWPAVPQTGKLVTVDQVKGYWYRALPRPAKLSKLDQHYYAKLGSYQAAIRRGRSLIRALRAGHYDLEAELAALRHNLALYERWGDTDNEILTIEAIAAIYASLPPVEQVVVQRPGIGRDPDPGSCPPPEDYEEEVEDYEEPVYDSNRDCPRPRRPRTTPPEVKPYPQVPRPPTLIRPNRPAPRPPSPPVSRPSPPAPRPSPPPASRPSRASSPPVTPPPATRSSPPSPARTPTPSVGRFPR